MVMIRLWLCNFFLFFFKGRRGRVNKIHYGPCENTGTPSSRVRLVAYQKYYKGLYGDLRDRYYGRTKTRWNRPETAKTAKKTQ